VIALLTGAAELGSCLTDATPEAAPRRTVRAIAAMLRSERSTQQSSRPFDPVEPCRPPCLKGYDQIVGPMILIVKQGMGDRENFDPDGILAD
jgi:hypothetical protein